MSLFIVVCFCIQLIFYFFLIMAKKQKFRKSGGASSTSLITVEFERPEFFNQGIDAELPPLKPGCIRERILVLSMRQYDFVPKDSDVKRKGTSIVYIELDKPGDVYENFFGFRIHKISGRFNIYTDSVTGGKDGKPLVFPYVTYIDINQQTSALDEFYTPEEDSE